MAAQVHQFSLERPRSMTPARIAVVAARILLGLLFTLAGGSIVVMLALNVQPPAMPGLAGAFQDVFFRSHWVIVVDAVEFAAGVLLLANRFVPFALILIAALLVNILTFHITMQPEGLPLPLVVVALWITVAYSRRTDLLPLLKQR
jgi:putative oxidoreductase